MYTSLVRKGHKIDAEDVLKDDRRHFPKKCYHKATEKYLHPKAIECDKIELPDNNITEEDQIYRKGDSYFTHCGEFI